MKLFEIDNKIEDILNELEVDPETGLLIESYKVNPVTGEAISLNEELENLLVEKDNKIKNVALYYLNLVSDANELEEQEKKFKARKEACKKKAERLKEFLSYYLNGEKREYPECVIKFGKSKVVELDSDFLTWAKENGQEYLRYKDPEPDKTKIKEAINGGISIEHASVVEKQNISIK